VTTTRRIFVALPMATADAERLAGWAATALDGRRLRLLAPAALHATVVFCGAVPAERVVEIEIIVRAATPANLSFRLAPRAVRVLGATVAAVYASDETLAATQATIARQLADSGLARAERRPWLPHVTVARARRGARPRLGPLEPPPVPLAGGEIAIYESLLSPSGATYLRL
jgi:2'-5' RNA ligase